MDNNNDVTVRLLTKSLFSHYMYLLQDYYGTATLDIGLPKKMNS